MRDTIAFNISCPDCGSNNINKPADFDFESHFYDVSCAVCGRGISKNDVISQAEDIALREAETFAKSVFGDDTSLK
ncbi:hypothetical protein D6364_01410 [Salmonella enterica subsp. enterica serovar Denver]|nr:hypothetical protein [Salmonella enterica subsp. enterica serovar Denver]ECE7751930.1 hypothetical protein [Salmonella enterica subsp. enterica serovar Ngili]